MVDPVMTDFRFKTREEASITVAEHMLRGIKRRLGTQGRVPIIVSGGSTPARCFSELASAEINWSQVEVFLSDERWVPPDHPDSNEKLVRDHLLAGAAKDALLHSVYQRDTSIEQRCMEIERSIRPPAFAPACALLGMGTDGHFASLFPDNDNLAAGLDDDGWQLCMPVYRNANELTRISLSLSALCRSDEILLLIFGEEKLQTLKKALTVQNRYPVSQLFLQTRTPVHVFWAP